MADSNRLPGPLKNSWLPALVLAASLPLASCGTNGAESKDTAQPASSESKMESGSQGSADAGSAAARKDASRATSTSASAGTHTVRLTRSGCVEFEPVWTDLRVGETVTFHSTLDVPITLHLSGDAFGRAEYVVRPGGTVRTGPAKGTGTFTIQSEPRSCQGAPRGVRGSGPGVMIEAAGN